MNKIVLITGATAGIGEACAHVFAKNGYDIIVTGRRKERLEELTKELQANYKVEAMALNFDIRSFADTEKAILSLAGKWKNIDVLVNNAGLAAGLAPIQEGLLSDWEQMIDTNIKGLLYISKMVMPIMMERKCGHIINLGSIAGKETYANGNVYCATKEAVDALSRGMRIDLLNYGIKVTAIHPGAVETEFSLVRFKGNEERAKQVYKGFEPLKAHDVANTIFYVSSLDRHICVNELTLMPLFQASATIIKKDL